jgi:hypothetical protein
MRTNPLHILLCGLLVGCAGWRGSGPDVDASRAPVVLRVEGPALATDDARNAAADALGRTTRRRVELADGGGDDALLREVAARAGVRRAVERDRRCASQADTLLAARRGADAVYRVTLSPAGTPSRGLFGETPVTGDAAVRVFDGSGARAPVHVAGDDVAAATTAGAAGLPAPPAARWDVVANGLVKAGCPLHALAVQELRLGDAKAGRSVRQKALAALGRGVPPPKAAPVASDPEPAPEATVKAAPPEGRFSCEALCGIHMVEVCNKDRTLWTQHLVAWERTGCGTRRTEPFLVECYRRQRISGTFHDACVAPCERSATGRAALLQMLQGAGCLRAGPS